MYVSVILLVVISAIFFVGYGKKVLRTFELSTGRAMVFILITLLFSLFPEFDLGGGVFVNIVGIWLIWLSLVWLLSKEKLKYKALNLIGIISVFGMSMLYKFYSSDVLDSVLGGLLFPIAVIITAYVTSKGALASFISVVLGVSIAVLVAHAIPQLATTKLVVGGDSGVMLISIVGAILLKEIVDKIAYLLKRNKQIDSVYEASDEDNFI